MSDSNESCVVPGPSTAEEIEDDSLHSELSKARLKTALAYAEKLFLENNYITSEPCTAISGEHIEIGKEIYEATLEILAEKKIVTEDELISVQELDEEGLFEEEVVESSSPNSSSEDYEPDEKKEKIDPDISLDYKIKVVNLARQHPTWNLVTLQRKGAYRLTNLKQLKKWREQIIHGGTKYDKFHIIDTWTYDRFLEAREGNQQVTTRNLQQWALSAASQFPDLDFQASNSWVGLFKQRHRIRQRKVTKFVSEKESSTMGEIIAAAENFRTQARAIIPNFGKDYVINTDQTGKEIGSYSFIHSFICM